MIINCSWCGRLIQGEPVAPGHGCYFEFGGQGENQVDYEVGYCSDGCAWRWGLESHGLFGITGKAARQHLIDEHGLKPGAPAGRPSQECWEHFTRVAGAIMAVVSPGETQIIGA